MQKWYDDEWHLFELPERLGGVGASPTLVWAGFEFVVEPTPPWLFTSLAHSSPGSSTRWATENQKKAIRFVTSVDGRWGATMVLTEPDAGSDVGAGRTKARHIDGDVLGTRRRQALHHQRGLQFSRKHRAPEYWPAPKGTILAPRT